MLVGDKVVLRSWIPDDLIVLQALRNNFPLQRQLMANPMGSSLEQVQEWLTRRTTSPDAVFYIIAEKAGNKPMGYVQLLGLEQQDGAGRLGICIDPESQGKGYGAETLTLLADYAHEVLHLSKITLEVLADNQSAIRLYKQNGYDEKNLLKAHFNSGTTLADVVVMEKLLAP